MDSSNNDSDPSSVDEIDKQGNIENIMETPIQQRYDQRPSTSREICSPSEDSSTTAMIHDQESHTAGTSERRLKRKRSIEDDPRKISEGLRLGLETSIGKANSGAWRKKEQLRKNVRSTGISLQGIMYELKYPILVSLRAVRMGVPFRLGTHMLEAGRFDDIVLEYENKNTGERIHRFIQLQLRRRRQNLITASDLVSEHTGFSMLRYFKSWRAIRNCVIFSKSILKDFMICTNIGLDIEGLRRSGIGVRKVMERDEFLDSTDSMGVSNIEVQSLRYKLAVDGDSALFDVLKSSSELYELAQALAQTVNSSSRMTLMTRIYRQYHFALAQEVIDIHSRKFFTNFIRNVKLSDRAVSFRGIFISKMNQLSKRKFPTEDAICKHCEDYIFTLPNAIGIVNEITELPDDEVQDQEISNFFDELVLAVEQPNETELDHRIKREIAAVHQFDHLNANLAANALQEKILNWYHAVSLGFLTDEDFAEYLDKIKRKLYSVAMILSSSYLEILEEYEIEFKRDNEEVRNFLCDSNGTRVLILVHHKQTILTSLWVQQTLNRVYKDEMKGSFLFIPLKRLLQQKTKRTVLDAFRYPSGHDILVINCKTLNSESLWDSLSNILKKQPAKRLILLCKEKFDSTALSRIGHKISFPKDVEMNFRNLTVKSQEKLLFKKVVKFQGQREIDLRTLLGCVDDCDKVDAFEKIIDVDGLIQLIRGGDIKIGSEVQGLDEMENSYYISRTTVHHVGGKEKRLDNDKFMDLDLSGIIILSGTSGMGKTTALTKLAQKLKERDSTRLVVKIDLSLHQNRNVLTEEENKRSFDDKTRDEAVDFLVDKLIKPSSGSQCFKGLIKIKHRATLLFDGFDKLHPKFADIVIDLLQALASDEITNIIVTTGPQSSRDLVKILKKSSHYALQPFSIKDQREFFIRFWERKWRSNDVDETTKNSRPEDYADDIKDLLANMLNDQMKEFTSIPLQTRMVAEVFLDFTKLPDSLNIIDLYRSFVNMKYQIYSKREQKKVDMTRMIFDEAFQKLALDALFNVEVVKALLSRESNTARYLIRESMEKGGKDIGIIDSVIEDEPIFVHRTYAEFFVAEFFSVEFLSKTLKDDSQNLHAQIFLLEKLFIKSEYATIRAFMNCIILSDKVVTADKEPWDLDLFKYRDADGRTVCHIAARERHAGIMRFFMNSHSPNNENSKLRNINIEDQEGRTALHIAICTPKNLDLVKCIVEDGRADINAADKEKKTPLLHAADIETGDLAMVKYLVEKGADIRLLSTAESEKTLKRKLDYAKGNLDVVRFFIQNKVSLNTPDEHGRTPLHYAVMDDGDVLDMVKFLIEEGADVNFQVEAGGPTPLHCAVDKLCKYYVENSSSYSGNSDYDRQFKVVRFLLENHADPNLKDIDGKTPKDLFTSEIGDSDMLQVLFK